METAKAAALRLRGGYRFGRGGSPSLTDLLQVAADLGVVVDLDWPLPGRVRSIYGYGAVALQKGLSRAWQRWCLAHELGHRCLHHAGNHFYLAKHDRHLLGRRESEAECFAGFLLFGALERAPDGVADVMDLAVAADLPLAATDRWARLIERRPQPFVSLDRMDVDYEALQAEPLRGEHRMRPWSPFLAASLLMAPLLRFDLDMDGAVQIARAAMHTAWLFI